MSQRQLNNRFWGSTRGRIILILRSGAAAVNDLAKTLGVTDNAVRAQLTALERDGLVQQGGARRGSRKPHLLYELTPEAEQLFPKVYGPVLRELLDVLKQTHSTKEIDKIVRAVGRRMAPGLEGAIRAEGTADRRQQAAAVLRELGGFCDSEAADKKIIFKCADCPLAAVVAAHPEACRLIETLLTTILGVRVRERCTPPQCEFEFSASVN
ncbi:MAG: ArsR family transcriptional regulator [Pirellulales bacterium]|nr:ArsR family transcriptional regulator [Pirellulales bacterium]